MSVRVSVCDVVCCIVVYCVLHGMSVHPLTDVSDCHACCG